MYILIGLVLETRLVQSTSSSVTVSLQGLKSHFPLGASVCPSKEDNGTRKCTTGTTDAFDR